MNENLIHDEKIFKAVVCFKKPMLLLRCCLGIASNFDRNMRRRSAKKFCASNCYAIPLAGPFLAL